MFWRHLLEDSRRDPWIAAIETYRQRPTRRRGRNNLTALAGLATRQPPRKTPSIPVGRNIAFDAHKHYTLASVARPDGRLVRERRLVHGRGVLQQFLAHCEPDLFGVRGRALLRQRLDLQPAHTAYATGQLLEQVESLDRQVTGFEHRIKSVFKPTLAIQRLTTLPGWG
jgi:hypothetical protein